MGFVPGSQKQKSWCENSNEVCCETVSRFPALTAYVTQFLGLSQMLQKVTAAQQGYLVKNYFSVGCFFLSGAGLVRSNHFTYVQLCPGKKKIKHKITDKTNHSLGMKQNMRLKFSTYYKKLHFIDASLRFTSSIHQYIQEHESRL